jgi:transposase-like protein
VTRHGHDDRQPERQRYRCTACQARFDDLTNTTLYDRLEEEYR